MKNSSSDHLPVVTSYSLDINKLRYRHTITKISFKDFNKERWNDALAQQDWLDVDECEDVNDMVTVFNNNMP